MANANTLSSIPRCRRLAIETRLYYVFNRVLTILRVDGEKRKILNEVRLDTFKELKHIYVKSKAGSTMSSQSGMINLSTEKKGR